MPFPPSSKAEPLSEVFDGVMLDAAGSLVGQVQRVLEELITTVRLRPGQLISEKEIAERLGASKTPVREAMIRLQKDGLLTVIPKSGTYVTPIRVSAYLDGCFTRLQLEIGAVRRAAERHEDVAMLDEMQALLMQQRTAMQASDYDRFFLLDETLHERFFQMAGVPGVWSVLRRTQSEVTRVRHLKRVQGIRRLDKVLADHERIVAAIGSGDADAAETALVQHIGTLDRELESLANHRELMNFIETQPPLGGRSRVAAACASG